MNDWKDDIIDSANNLSSAQAPANAFNKIQNRRKRLNATKVNDLSLMVAAAVSLIIIGNAYLILNTPDMDNKRKHVNTEQVTTDYNIYQ